MNGARIPELAEYDSGRTGTVISDKTERYLEGIGYYRLTKCFKSCVTRRFKSCFILFFGLFMV